MGELSLVIINVLGFFPNRRQATTTGKFLGPLFMFCKNSIGCFHKHIKRTYFHSFYYIILLVTFSFGISRSELEYCTQNTHSLELVLHHNSHEVTQPIWPPKTLCMYVHS